MIEDAIKNNIENPEELERLYHENMKHFRSGFLNIYPEIADNKLAEYWKIRLTYAEPNESKEDVKRNDVIALIVSCVITGFLIKLPVIFNFSANSSLFYEKNVGLIIFLGLSIYTIFTRKNIKKQHLIITAIIFLLSATYINLLPSGEYRHSVNLAYIHLPLFLWCVYGVVFIDFNTKETSKRLDYIKYNGDIAIMVAIILIAGAILAGVTFGLFSAIDIKIEKFYINYIAIWGLSSSPIVATFIIRNFPSITNKIAPIIANIFSPLVFITLVIYLLSILYTGKDPYNNRDFLLVFNLMLLGVMGIIVFSISESFLNKKQRFSEITLLLLVAVSLLIDIIALSAILYRLGEFGFSPNRTAVLGSNLLIFGNLLLILIDLLKVNFKGAEINKVETTISIYLPIYTAWTIFVVFGFPLIFGLR